MITLFPLADIHHRKGILARARLRVYLPLQVWRFDDILILKGKNPYDERTAPKMGQFSFFIRTQSERPLAKPAVGGEAVGAEARKRSEAKAEQCSRTQVESLRS